MYNIDSIENEETAFPDKYFKRRRVLKWETNMQEQRQKRT